MKRFACLLVLNLLFAAFAFGQSFSFADTNVEYTFELPEPTWKMVKKPSASVPSVEYVYRDRFEGHLEIRKTSLKEGELIADLIKDQDLKFQILDGYVQGKPENFAGAYRGTVYNYEYVKSGKPMSGRFYFLKTDNNTVYVLRFTGYKDRLRLIRNQTDSIARTFKLKAS
jgi:hypothetical protein